MAKTPIRLGMVGGGDGAFIGEIHRIAARMDGNYSLVAGALSSDPERAKHSGETLGLAADRIYADYRDMARREADRSDGIDAVVIVTPNNLHAPVARAFLNAGHHVICDKPLSTNLRDAQALASLAENRDRLFAVTYNYSAYPMIRLLRDMIQDSEIGRIRLIHAEYLQDWLTTSLEAEGHKQASWRTDPERAGIGGALGDIGVHVFQLAEFTTGLKATSVLADLSSFGKNRVLDDNASLLMRWENGARGTLTISQTAPGSANGLRVRIYGEKGGLEWNQERPDSLFFTLYGDPTRHLTRAGAGYPHSLLGLTRIPAGHPEGYLEAFANLYTEIADAIRSWNTDSRPRNPGFTMVETGVRGMKFITACVESHREGNIWHPL